MIVADEKRKLISGIYIQYPKDGLVCGRSSEQKKQPTFFDIQHDLPCIFPKLILFSHHNLSRLLSRRSGYCFIDIFTKVTPMGASMHEASSTPKAMK